VSAHGARYEVDGWGVGELWVDEGLAVWHELPVPAAEALTPALPGAPRPTTRFHRTREPVTRGARDSADSVTIRSLLARLEAYFGGAKVSFAKTPLDLSWYTPFQRAVAQALRAVPHGEVVTYGELAALAGHPNAQRAVGSFCARNRVPLFLPCHRVVAADGVGPYGGLGSGYKRRLLELEGVDL
jgi:methylated-DNA-[protein]-cysteine S-methyltransferase